jgi:hypothetical protein
MKSRFLFPNRYKRIGWALFIPGLILSIANFFFELKLGFLDASRLDRIKFYQYTDANLTNEVAWITVIIGAIFLAFSKEKVEDEQISKVRLESLQWSVYLNYGILILLIISIHGAAFLQFTYYNMFTLLIVFLIRFHYVLYKQNKLKEDEYEK